MRENNENDENFFPLRATRGTDGVSESLHCPFLIVLVSCFYSVFSSFAYANKIDYMKQLPMRIIHAGYNVLIDKSSKSKYRINSMAFFA